MGPFFISSPMLVCPVTMSLCISYLRDNIVQMAQVQFTSHMYLSEDIWSSGCYNRSTSFFYWVGLTSKKRAIVMPINKYNYHTLWDILPCWSLLSFRRLNKTINYFSFLEVCWASTYTMRSWSSMRRLPSQFQFDFSKSRVPKSLQWYLQFWKH